MTTGFFWDERCFWHGGGNYAGMLPVGGLVQPMDGGLPESPEATCLSHILGTLGVSCTLCGHKPGRASTACSFKMDNATRLRSGWQAP